MQAFYPAQAPIDSYGNGGFRFADMSHRGSVLCLPSGMYGWDVTSMGGLDVQSIGPILEEAGAIEVLLLGTGAQQVFLTQSQRVFLDECGIFAEAMATGPAARTYNVLLAEGRAVAAALIAVE